MATPTALEAFVQCLCGSPTAMLMRLNRLLGRQDGERRETRERPREDGLQSPSHTSRKKWFWGKRSESWAGDRELPEGGRLKLILSGVGLRRWEFLGNDGPFCFSELLKSRPRIEDF